jgi:hypothetical protein
MVYIHGVFLFAISNYCHDRYSTTVVPGTAGHHWDKARVSARGRRPLIEGTGSDKKVQVHVYLNFFIIPVTQTAAIRVDKPNVLQDWDAGCRANMQNMCELCAAYICGNRTARDPRI